MNKVITFQKKLLSDTFMEKLTNSSIRNEILSSILDSYSIRVRLKMSQKEYANLHQISIATLKRIELGKCYDVTLINKYSNI